MNLSSLIFDIKINTIKSQKLLQCNKSSTGWMSKIIYKFASHHDDHHKDKSVLLHPLLRQIYFNTQFRPNDLYPYTRSLQLALFFLKCIFLLFFISLLTTSTSDSSGSLNPSLSSRFFTKNHFRPLSKNPSSN